MSEETNSIVSRRTDERRRFNMPDECPPNALLTVQQIEPDAWLVRRVKSEKLMDREIVPDCDCKAGTRLLAVWPTCAKCGKPWQLKKPAADTAPAKVT